MKKLVGGCWKWSSGRIQKEGPKRRYMEVTDKDMNIVGVSEEDALKRTAKYRSSSNEYITYYYCIYYNICLPVIRNYA